MEIYGKRLCPLNLTQDVFKLDFKQFLCYSWTCDIVKTLFVRCLCWRWRLLIAGTKLHLVSERWKLRILRQMRWSLPQTWGDPFFRELYNVQNCAKSTLFVNCRKFFYKSSEILGYALVQLSHHMYRLCDPTFSKMSTQISKTKAPRMGNLCCFNHVCKILHNKLRI